MKKFLSFLFILAFVLGGLFLGRSQCQAVSVKSASAKTNINKKAKKKPIGWWRGKLTTVSPGKLTMATSPDFAPYEFYAVGENGSVQLAGFEISLAKYIAEYIGLELNIVIVDFDATITELQTRSVDLGISGYSPKPERRSIMDFSDIFYTGGQSFVCLRKNKHLFTSLADTNNARYSIGAQTASIQFDLAQKYSPNSNIVALPKVTDVIADLLAGNLDGAYFETVIAESYKKNYPELEIVLSVPFDFEGSVIGVSKGNKALLAAVNEAIASALADGSMERFIAEAVELAAKDTCTETSKNVTKSPKKN